MPMGPTPGPAWADVLTTGSPAWGVNAVLLVLTALYLAAARGHGAWPVRRTLSFLAAIASAVVTWNSGIAVFGHQAFAVHMVMHLMLIMVLPAFWVAAHPLELLRSALPERAGARFDAALDSRASRALFFPGTVLVFYALVVVLTHLTSFMEAMAGSMALHHAEQGLYLVAGVLFFHVAIGVDLLPNRPAYFVRYVLMALAMGVDTLVGVVLMQAPATMFPSYDLEGVHLGGALMWVVGDGLMMVIMVLLGRLWVTDASAKVDFGPWLESARQDAFREQTGAGRTDRAADLDDDDEALAAYNRMLARLDRGEH
ncbi:cytochrome c oxidase assembly protein [Actinomycetospora soli]|uniref:cytochrome c oxidase assembly protein n=1 Tax=Actinomycetospora soli TaxID=2893887 RepID=UPI001E37D511|nr:cytochrome c oxidase assembly protein [Actinomycetospora soli]MCD2185564.1 cytochrome c oxidase assembly protein [Actinomycetospora soli]